MLPFFNGSVHDVSRCHDTLSSIFCTQTSNTFSINMINLLSSHTDDIIRAKIAHSMITVHHNFRMPMDPACQPPNVSSLIFPTVNEHTHMHHSALHYRLEPLFNVRSTRTPQTQALPLRHQSTNGCCSCNLSGISVAWQLFKKNV